MPRQLHIEYPGAVYHVMSRGDRRADIFLGDVDRQEYLKTLAEACKKLLAMTQSDSNTRVSKLKRIRGKQPLLPPPRNPA